MLFLSQAAFRCQADLERFFREPDVCIILSEQRSVFGPGGKHPIGFFGAFGDEVVYENAYISHVPTEGKRRLLSRLQRRVYPRDDALRRSLFVAGGSVDLPCKIKIFKCFGFEGRFELRRRKVIVFYGIARPQKFYIFKTAHGAKGFILDILGQRR